MMEKELKILLLCAAAVLCLMTGCSQRSSEKKADSVIYEILNMSCDSNQEFFASYNELFEKHWQEEKKGSAIHVEMSYGSSGKQAEEVFNSKKGDVVTFSDPCDILNLVDKGMIQKGWESEFENDSSPYSSILVFLVRKGNEKEVFDWGDLVKEGVDVIMPNPQTSGCGRLGFLASWDHAQKEYYQDEEKSKRYMKRLYRNVLVMDSGARDAVSTFVERGQGDVLVTWESEACLSQEEYPDDYEVVIPKTSILGEASIALVDEIAQKNGSEGMAKEYLEYMYSEDAQRLFAECYFRPADKKISKEFSEQFPSDIEFLDIDDLGGWKSVYQKFFEKGGIFEKVTE